MTTISLDIPATKKSEAYKEIFTTLVNSYDVEEIEDFMFGLHTIKNDEQDVVSSQDFRKKYAGRRS